MTTDTNHILKLAEIIREVDGSNKLGAAALAEAILSHPDSRWRPAVEPEPEGLTDAAQAVVNAAVEAGGGYGKATPVLHARLAAALEAAADQVVPEEPIQSTALRWMYERDTRQSIRSELLAIAAELRGPTTTQEDN